MMSQLQTANTLLLQVCRIHCATANPVSVIIAKTSEEAKVSACLLLFCLLASVSAVPSSGRAEAAHMCAVAVRGI